MSKEVVLLGGMIFLHLLLFVSASRSLERHNKGEYRNNEVEEGILDFTNDNVENIFNSKTKDNEQLKDHFKLIKRQLYVKSGNLTVQEVFESIGASGYISSVIASANSVKDGLKSLQEYLEKPEDKFLRESLELSGVNIMTLNLENMIDGLLHSMVSDEYNRRVDAIRFTTNVR